jgi:uncharacterized ParB-like nuclease family protein
MRDGFTFEPIDVQVHPEEREKYRILDGVHRWQAYKSLGTNEIEAHIVRLDGCDPRPAALLSYSFNPPMVIEN